MRQVILIFIFISLGNSETCWTLGRIKYSGGGDWYADPTSLPNLLKRVKSDLRLNVCPEEKTVQVLDGDLYRYPVLYLTGHGNIVFSKEERRELAKYLYNGGLLIADDNYGLDSSFRREMSEIFPQHKLTEVERKHPVFSSFYKFSRGLPKIHEHDGKKPQLFNIELNGKSAVLYSYESDLGDGWENAEVHKVPPVKRERALRMGVNIFAWFVQGQGVE